MFGRVLFPRRDARQCVSTKNNGNYPATGEQAAGFILIILKYIEIKSSNSRTLVKGESYTQDKPRRKTILSGLRL